MWFNYAQKLLEKVETSLINDKSIAVLPFENLNKSLDQQYFSDGISQDILTNLSGIKDLMVISFNSSKQFRTTDLSSEEIGQTLGAKHLLSGSVQQNYDQLRIRATLVDAETGEQLWAERYDRKMEDVFQIQSEVSSEIATVLKATILPEVAARIQEIPTNDLSAYQAYTQGRALWELRGRDNLLEAEQHFLKAIELDTSFAEAYAGLALTYIIIGINDPPFLDKSKSLAEKAIELNPNISDAYVVLGEYYFRSKTDFKNSMLNYEKAIDLEPGNATAYQWYADMLVSKGEIKKGRQMINLAQKIRSRVKDYGIDGYNFSFG